MSQRLVAVSNRLPIVMQQTPEGEREITAGSGGLVRALGPVLRERGGTWIGWLGSPGQPDLGGLLEDTEREFGYELKPVPLSRQEIDDYYRGFANETLWPLFHDLLDRCRFEPSYWAAYREVNRKFARAVAENSGADDFVWVQDYHLALVADQLRELGAERHTAYFLHTPFPALDIFVRLPWRRQILEALLEFDLVGLQTMRDRRNFLQCVRALLPETEVEGAGGVVTVRTSRRELRVGAFPISIAYQDFVERAASPEVVREVARIRGRLPGRKLILGVDRLDYSKGIPQRIQAFAEALARHPDLRRRVTLVQVVVPSRTAVPEYQELKDEIDRLVGEVNGRFTEAGWTPIHYIFHSLEDTELLAFYRTAEVALVTPLKDGMNLVAKEYCTCSMENDGVLVLSEFAGAAAQLQVGALLVNPFDQQRTAETVHRACTMEPEERGRRMRALRERIAEEDIHRWVEWILRAASDDAAAAPPAREMVWP